MSCVSWSVVARGVASCLVALSAALAPSRAFAGPPFVTDDPEPVELHHWEFYVASQNMRDDEGWSGTAPHVEVNYGVLPETQVHVIAPLAYSAPAKGASHYGYGDTELGMKLRLVKESKWVPMIATFPLLEAPSGDASKGLGNGSTQLFVPIWIQKTFGDWTTYGGGGAWLDTKGAGERWALFGAELQYKPAKWLTVGGETFVNTPHGDSREADWRYNFGAIFDIGDANHIMLSEGRCIIGVVRFQSYFAYQLTI